MPLDLTDFEPVDAQPVAALDMSDFEPVEAALDMSDFEVIPPTTEPAGGATASGPPSPGIEAPSAVPAEPVPPLEFGTRFVKGMAQSTTQAAAGAARLAKLAKPLMPVGGQLIPSGAWDDIADFAKDVQDSAAEVYKTDPRGDERLISKVAQGAGSIVPIIASGPLAIATGGAMAGEAARQEAEAAGASEGQQEATLALNAVTGAITEKLLGVPALLKSAKAAGLTGPGVVAGIRSAVEKAIGRVGYQTVASGLREGGQEFLQQLASNAIAKGIYEPARDIFQGGLENFLVGTLVGGPLGAGVQVAQNIDTRRAAQAPAVTDDMAAAAAPVAAPSIDVIPPDFEPIAAEAEAAGAPLVADALRQTISEAPQPQGGEPADATQERQITESREPEYPRTEEARPQPEAERSDSVEAGWEKPQEVAPTPPKPPELMTPDEVNQGYLARQTDGTPFLQTRSGPGDPAANASEHSRIIATAMSDQKPVSLAAVEAYQIELPKGYVREGDIYVYKPSTAETGAQPETVAGESDIQGSANQGQGESRTYIDSEGVTWTSERSMSKPEASTYAKSFGKWHLPKSGESINLNSSLRLKKDDGGYLIFRKQSAPTAIPPNRLHPAFKEEIINKFNLPPDYYELVDTGDAYEPGQKTGYLQVADKYVGASGVQGAIATIGPPLQPSASPAPVVAVKAQSQIVRDIAKGLNLPIRFGRSRHPRFGGYFAKIQNLILSNKASDIPVISHESGHKLDDTFGLSKLPALRTELDILGDPATPDSRSSWTKSKSLKYKHGEGVAEFVRYWMTDPARASKMAPMTERYWNSVLDANPDMGDVMRQARKDIQNWRNAPAEARLDSSISVGSNPNKTRYGLSQLTRDLVDDLEIIRIATDDAQRLSGAKLQPSQNPYMLSRLLRGSYGMADTFIRSGTVDFATKKVTLGTGLEDALKPVAGNINAFRRWIVAKRAQEIRAQGKEHGLVDADVDFVAAKYNADPAFQEAFTKLKTWSDALLKYAVDSGYVSQESADAMRKMNQDYVPFARIFEVGAGEDPSQQGGGIGRGLNVGKAGSLRRLTGSTRDIVDPLETLVKNAYVLITAAEKTAINAAIGDMANKPGMGKWVEQIGTPKEGVRVAVEKVRKQLEDAGADMDAVPDDLLLNFFQNSGRAPWGENVIKVTRGGKTTFYRLKSDLFDAFHALDNEDSSRIIQILSSPAQLLRAGVTLTPDFALSNMMRDAFSSAVINRYGMLPFEGAIRGMAAMLKNPQLVSEWSASGGAQAFEANFFDREKISKFMRDRITKDLTPAERSMVVLKSPLTALRMFTGALESVTRIGEFQKAFEAAVGRGMPEGEARRLAAFESRDRQDFAKGGAKTKILRHAAAFWNAQLQANVKLYHSVKERPVRTLLQGFIFVTIPKLIEQAVNWDDEDYWDRPQWERDLFFMIPAGKDANGHTRFVRIPTPFEVGLIFGTIPGRMLQWARSRDKQSLDGLMHTVIAQTVPNPMPQAVQVVVSDLLTGKKGWDIYRGRQIVPESISDLPAELQWTEQTSLTARKVGGMLGFSPMKVDHIIAGTAGGLGRQIVHNVIDRAIGLATGEEPTAVSVAPGMRFVATPAGISSESVTKFYDEFTELREQRAAAKLKNKPMANAGRLRRMEAAADRMSDLRKAARKEKDAVKKQRFYLQISEIAQRVK